MRRIAYLLLAAISLLAATNNQAPAETRPHYGGTLRVMLQASPSVLDLPANATPTEYWDLARTLSLIGDTLVRSDAQGRPQPALAVAWQSDGSASRWQFTLRRGVKFHDGSAASPPAVAQILSALQSGWIVRASGDTIAIETAAPMPSLPAELALPRNLLLKRNAQGVPLGTGPFLVAEWQPHQLLKLAANEESWEGRPFVDAVEIEFGKALRDQAIALELGKTDVIEEAPQAANGSQPHNESSSLSLPIELLALVFPANSRAIDPRLREALALAIDRKPIQSVLLKGAGEPAASILPNWMTGYSAVFSVQPNLQEARTLLAESRQPASALTYNLSYDPRDPQAQLIAERIELNAREVGIAVQISLSGAEDIRLIRVVLPSPDPGTSLSEAARELGLPQPPFSGNVEDLYQAERSALMTHAVIPLFHLPVATAVGARVREWAPDRRARWSASELSLADLWLADQRLADQRPADERMKDQRSAAPRVDLHAQAESQ
ncbi:MAG TPA: ABC transporter substrate-binding protein [Terriglobales bacterium]|jgi:ABC-type transport system substrate-binding protein|nr:ABC transporter substrate-binding protein [Terriglobales bacterium]